MELKNEIKIELKDSIKEDLYLAIVEHGKEYFHFEPKESQVEIAANQLIENFLSNYLDIRELDRVFDKSLVNEI